MFLYKISFPEHLTTKCYIGITKQTLEKRLKKHCLKSSDTLISRAIRKYGKDNLTMSVIAEYDSWEELNNAEQKAIKHFNTLNPNGYNQTIGGLCGLSGLNFTDEHRSKISIARKGMVFTDDHKKNISTGAKQRMKGNLEHIRKMQDGRGKGELNPRYGIPREKSVKDKISKSLTGLTASAETKNKMSIAGRIRESTPLSGFKGVTKNHNKWTARARVDRKTKHIGSFNTPEEASEAYQKFVANLPC